MTSVAFFCPWSLGWALAMLDTRFFTKHCVAERKHYYFDSCCQSVWGARCLSFRINLPNLLEDPLRFHFQT